VILVLTVVGTYADNFRVMDIWLMLVIGFVSLILLRNDYPFAPMILGFVLGPLLEDYLRKGLMRSDGIFSMLATPVSISLVLLAIGVLVVNLYQEIKSVKTVKTNGNVYKVSGE